MKKEAWSRKEHHSRYRELLANPQILEQVSILAKLWRNHQVLDSIKDLNLPPDVSILVEKHPAITDVPLGIELLQYLSQLQQNNDHQNLILHDGRMEQIQWESGLFYSYDAQHLASNVMWRFCEGLLLALSHNQEVAQAGTRKLHQVLEKNTKLYNTILAHLYLNPRPHEILALHAEELKNYLQSVLKEVRDEQPKSKVSKVEYELEGSFGEKFMILLAQWLLSWVKNQDLTIVPRDRAGSSDDGVHEEQDLKTTLDELIYEISDKKLVAAVASNPDHFVKEWEEVTDLIEQKGSLLDQWVAQGLLTL